MSNNFKQIFFIFVQNNEIADIQIKDLNSFNNELKNIKKVYSSEIDNKKTDLYSIFFKINTKSKSFTLLFFDKNKKKKYSSESIKFKNDIDNFIYDFKIYGDTGALIKFVSIGFYQEKEYILN